MDRKQGFPDTQNTWIVDGITGGREGEVRAHLMAVYVEPLQRMALARFRLDNEGTLDLVHGFFASRLGRADYLQQWRERKLPLRHWLWNGLCYFAREHARNEHRQLRTAEIGDVPDQRLAEPGVELDRAFAASIVREAMRRAEVACHRDGFAEYWHVFVKRYRHDQSAASIARELGMRPERAIVMLRAPRRRFRQAIFELLAADGVPVTEIPRALRELQDLLP